MTDLLPHPVADRRQPRISHEELRKHLIAADEERYVLRIELDAARAAASGRRWRSWTPSRRRAAVGIATVIMTGLAGGLAWQMCPSSAGADDRSSVRVE